MICTFTNQRHSADLPISRTHSITRAVSGAQTQYPILVTNAGPATANSVVIRDAAMPALTCSTVTCTVSAGAVCPAVSILALQSPAGLSIATLPANGTLTLTMTCTVNGWIVSTARALWRCCLRRAGVPGSSAAYGRRVCRTENPGREIPRPDLDRKTAKNRRRGSATALPLRRFPDV